jgi:membrane-bound inhibitor of C-type lysozyme
MRTLFVLAAVALTGCASMSGSTERRVTYACERGADLTVVFDGGAARIVNPDGSEIVLPSRETGSGFLYETPTHSLRGQGTEAIYTIGRMAPIRCQQNNTANM